MRSAARILLCSLTGRLKSTHSIRYVSNFFLFIGLVLGLYVRWLHSDDIAILLIAFLGLFVFSASAALVYYFSALDVVGFALLRLWTGCLLAVVGLTASPLYEDETSTQTQGWMNTAFSVSLLLRTLWVLCDRILHSTHSRAEFHLLKPMDSLEIGGVVIATLVVGKDFIPAALLSLGLLVTLAAVRVKSSLALLYLCAFLIYSAIVFFPKLLDIHPNIYALACLVGRLILPSLADWYFVGLSPLQRWEGFLRRGRSTLCSAVVLVLLSEVTCVAAFSWNISSHKEWYVVVPLFGAALLLWAAYHLLLIAVYWSLVNKISNSWIKVRHGSVIKEDCEAVEPESCGETVGFYRAMSAAGLRQFALISRCIALVACATTLLIGVLAWETKTAVAVGLWSLVLPLEMSVCSLMSDLANELGGTCVGYALVAPVLAPQRSPSGSSVSLVSPGTVQTASHRCTRVIETLQRFFSFHLIDSFGADYSSGGQSLDGLESKLKLLFQRVTADGLRYDTYVVCYCGPSYKDGDWALTDGQRLSLEHLMTIWRSSDCGNGSRLILVLDTDSSYHWLDQIRRVNDSSVAIQTWRPSRDLMDRELSLAENPYMGHSARKSRSTVVLDLESESLESGVELDGMRCNSPEPLVGTFMLDWIDFSCTNERCVEWQHTLRYHHAVYAVTRTWTDVPTAQSSNRLSQEEMSRYIDENFPRMVAAAACGVTAVVAVGWNKGRRGCFEGLGRCMRRKRMAWLPPIECETGHGFKLVRTR